MRGTMCRALVTGLAVMAAGLVQGEVPGASCYMRELSRIQDPSVLLSAGHHGVKLSPEEMRRLTLWLDSNCLFYGHDDNIEAQAAGEIVQPSLQ